MPMEHLIRVINRCVLQRCHLASAAYREHLELPITQFKASIDHSCQLYSDQLKEQKFLEILFPLLEYVPLQ